ncbi:MAG: DUF2959 domain-containing protein [Gammaproteobacteria bacterium]|nr:DUF2959 domain-containing protein [Gammaproteobacteria bacterium]
MVKHIHLSSILSFTLLILIISSLTGCNSAYLGALESIGIPKREVMKFRVEKARETQEETKEQFKTAMERFTELTNFQGGDLEATYKELNSEFEASEKKVKDINYRISEIENVSDALFSEWESELDQYSNAKLRSRSEQKLRETRTQYGQLIASMKKAESKTEPVLAVFRDNVLYLKHNLNAKAISSLQDDLKDIRTDVAVLIDAMEQSIRESDEFIKTLDEIR